MAGLETCNPEESGCFTKRITYGVNLSPKIKSPDNHPGLDVAS